jgi:hypothetical protein
MGKIDIMASLLNEIKLRIDVESLKKIVVVECAVFGCKNHSKDSSCCNLKEITVNENGECDNKCSK